MPKKMGVNSKAEAARARKSAAESDRKEREAREKEENYWREAEGPKSKAAKKREEDAEKRAEAAARRAEARRQAEMEEKEIDKAMKKPDKKANPRSVEEAIAQMAVADNLPADRHPERRLKASFKAFEEAELPRLKEEKPGLTHTQYKDLIWKLWKKSPDNPLNQANVRVIDAKFSSDLGSVFLWLNAEHCGAFWHELIEDALLKIPFDFSRSKTIMP
ncbi:hypothetical protein GOBAR_AA08965 [Gossypium barbadense]|uniref:Coiled-coil domain-containing protein n=1 Tax=Gossypium barbadense TaxID=3634 RepID=A0A2P5Y7X0_GOSBA|nr:hypothetical protein GOBAR_AA08965 [Gossypium barbadense]